jgi:hypothetical protein
MKVMYSPIISQASGAAGPVVASRWKGINYMRERVVPANPQLPAQMTHRARLTRAVAWYHDIEDQLRDYIKTLVTGLAMSGFNAFAKSNIHAQYQAAAAPIVPANTAVNPVASLVAAAGAASGQIALTWTQGDADGANKAYILVGLSNVDEDYPENLVTHEKDTTLISALARTISGLTPGAYYMVFLLVEVVATHQFSIARSDVAQAKA